MISEMKIMETERTAVCRMKVQNQVMGFCFEKYDQFLDWDFIPSVISNV